MSQKIITNLWFDGDAEEAAQFYVDVFGEDSKVELVTRVPEGPSNAGEVLTVVWTLRGQTYVGINGGSQFPFTPAISLQVVCADQAEIDYFWERLGEGGKEIECGWLTDRFGLAWQVVPEGIQEMYAPDQDPDRAARTYAAMLKMQKLDVEELRRAADGVAA